MEILPYAGGLWCFVRLSDVLSYLTRPHNVVVAQRHPIRIALVSKQTLPLIRATRFVSPR